MGTPGDQRNIERLPQIITEPDQQQPPPNLPTQTDSTHTNYHLTHIQSSANMPNVLSHLTPQLPSNIPTIGPDIDISLLKHELEPSITDLAPSLTELLPSISDLDIDRLRPNVGDLDIIQPGPSGLHLRSGNGKKGTSGSSRKVPGGYQCGHCQKVFPNTSKLVKHQQTIHSSTASTSNAPFKCDHCKKAFSSKFKLVRHSLIHSDRRPFSCTVCNRTFHRKDHLKNHCKVHDHSKELYVCAKSNCKKEYTSHLSYKKHQALHAAEEGNLNCQLCHKGFKTKDEVLMHLKVHAGSRPIKNPDEKKYRCDSCDRRFFTRKDVRRHEVVHTGMRDFLCQFCPERFGRKDHLIRHIKKLHYQQSSTCLDQLRSSTEPSQLLGGLSTPSTSSSSIPAIKLEAPEGIEQHLPPEGIETDFYDPSMDFLFGSSAVVARSSAYEDDDENVIDDDDNRGFSGIVPRSVDFKHETLEPLEDLGINVLEDIASGTQVESELTDASVLDLGDATSTVVGDTEFIQMLQQTGKLPAFDQIFQQQSSSSQQQQMQMQNEPPD